MSESYAYGIDVSHYQGDIDWVKVKATQEIKFAILKATEGVSKIDDHFLKNASALNNILPFDDSYLLQTVGVYHYFIPTDSPKDQAAFFAATIKNTIKMFPNLGTYLTNCALSYIIVDVEEFGGLNADSRIRALYAFLQEMDAALWKINILMSMALVYTGDFIWNTYYYPVQTEDAKLMLSDITHNRGLWLADFTGNVNKTPTLPLGWYDWTLWQYTDSGTINGVNGLVDISVRIYYK